MAKQFNEVNCSRGAPMGRPGWLSGPEGKVRLFRVNLDSGGYDDGGAYWGLGKPLYCCTDDMNFRYFVRASTRREAFEKAKNWIRAWGSTARTPRRTAWLSR